MNKEKFNILHLSDTHFGNQKHKSRESIKSLAIKICNDLHSNGDSIDFVVVTGDIIDGKTKNKTDEYCNAIIFFETLKSYLNTKFQTNIQEDNFLFVPGNHDLERNKICTNEHLHEYSLFLDNFYKTQIQTIKYNKQHYYNFTIIEKFKTIILGLNSCMIEPDEFQEENFLKRLINTGQLDSIVNPSAAKNLIDVFREEKRKEWDDYGLISAEQLDYVFNEISKKYNVDEYFIISAFHHHIYPFPETYDNIGDKSMMRNFKYVIDMFFKYNVQLVLHGHKHIPIDKVIPSENYFNQPDKMIYVSSSGSVGSKTHMHYKVISIYHPDSSTLAQIRNYRYELESLQPISACFIPPDRSCKNISLEVINLLKREKPSLHNQYQQIASNNASKQYQVDKIINEITSAVTKFERVNSLLLARPELIYIMLLSIHFRIISTDHFRKKNDNTLFLTQIEDLFVDLFNDKILTNDITNLLKCFNSATLTIKVKDMYDKYASTSRNYVEAVSFSVIAQFFTDMFITLGSYGNFYYVEEGIDHKINIMLSDELQFREQIELASIELTSETERRCARISFKCKNPTVHKVAVLIVKDFEERLSAIEECFKKIGLQIYYIRTHVSKNNYDLENLNFEAYIPTLLPLLTGENIYNSREVFIRELIQNSLDAILLRKELQNKLNINTEKKYEDFDQRIYITFGTERDENNTVRNHVTIKDYGIGMDKFKIERYFTSIGRSFYVSRDFKELSDSNNLKYKPISNFGIGFLSAFMAGKEIKVVTKNFESDAGGLQVDIPNYDGCFFVQENISKKDYGTEITIYEEPEHASSRKIDFTKITKYIDKTILDLQLDIVITDEKGDVKDLKAHALRNKALQHPTIFIPFSENGILSVNHLELQENVKNYRNGLFIIFEHIALNLEENHSKNYIELNEGIILSTNFTQKVLTNTEECTIFFNFPSSYLQLDVAREKIMSFRHHDYPFLAGTNFHSCISEKIKECACDLMSDTITRFQNLKFSILNKIYHFTMSNTKYSHQLRHKLLPKTISVIIDIQKQSTSTSTFVDLEILGPNKLQICVDLNSSLESYINLLTRISNVNIDKSLVKEKLNCITSDGKEKHLLRHHREHLSDYVHTIMSDLSSDFPELISSAQKLENILIPFKKELRRFRLEPGGLLKESDMPATSFDLETDLFERVSNRKISKTIQSKYFLELTNDSGLPYFIKHHQRIKHRTLELIIRHYVTDIKHMDYKFQRRVPNDTVLPSFFLFLNSFFELVSKCSPISNLTNL